MYLFVAVDVFSKWVEAVPLKSKHSFCTADALYNKIVARWGWPAAIRLDNGSEWEGEFKDVCTSLGI